MNRRRQLPRDVISGVLSLLLLGCPNSALDDDDDSASVASPWESHAALLAPLQEQGVVAWRGELVVVGGFGPAPVARVEAYDPASDSWRALPDLPYALHHPNLAAIDDQLIMAGQLTELSFASSGETWILDADASAWRLASPMPPGRARGAATTAVVAGSLYVIGGQRDRIAVTDVDRYDPATDSWTELAPLPEAREHLCSAAVQGRIYAIAGRQVGGEVFDNVYGYDPLADRWQELAGPPTARGGHACAALDGLIYVFGGEGNPDREDGLFDQVEAFDPLANRWSELPPMERARHGGGAAALDGAIWLPGGADREGFGPVDWLDSYTP